MFKLSIILAILAANLSHAAPSLSTRDVSNTTTSTGSGKPPGTQFITGPCGSDSDCASGCCGFKSGKCAGAIVAQERDGGCGFGDPQPNDRAAQALRNGQSPIQPPIGAGAAPPAASSASTSPPPPSAANASTSTGSGKPPGTQFITGPCGSDSDCASGCCGFKSGKCAGAIVAQERDGGCGFGDAQPNDRAAQALRNGQSPIQPPASAAAPAPVADPASPPPAAANTTTSTGSGKPPGTQFITGPCASDSDCASGCCGFKSGKCAGAIVAQERDGGCGFGDAQPNDRAAQALRNGQLPIQPPTGTAVAAPPAATSATASTGSGKPPGTQFITGPCGSDADCASACCGFKSGKCAGPVVAQERDGGCGFGDPQPNDDAAKALTGQTRRAVFIH